MKQSELPEVASSPGITQGTNSVNLHAVPSRREKRDAWSHVKKREESVTYRQYGEDRIKVCGDFKQTSLLSNMVRRWRHNLTMVTLYVKSAL